jgi:hypothetical protein
VTNAAQVVVYSAPYTWAEIHNGMGTVESFAAQAGIAVKSVAEDILHDRITVSVSDLRPEWTRRLHT